MESVVAALLRDFEGGKLSRRQLVQTLALMAVGSPVASAVERFEEARGTRSGNEKARDSGQGVRVARRTREDFSLRGSLVGPTKGQVKIPRSGL